MDVSGDSFPPHFAIVGAAKCGTTALYHYLSGHPDVAMSSRKEPCFWSPDICRVDRVERGEDYQALWAQAAPAAQRGEASTAYIESQIAVPSLLTARPNVKLIAMIRNPVEMAASRHSDLLFRFQEDVPDFELAWRLQEQRQKGRRLPPECSEPQTLQYAQGASIGDMLERFFAWVPVKQRLVIVFDDLKMNADTVYLQTLSFLGLPDDGRRGFSSINTNRNMRSVRMAALHRSLGRRLGSLYRPARATVRSMGLSPSAIINRLNVYPGRRRPLSHTFESELIKTFSPQIEKAAALIDRDLSHWMRTRP